MVPPEIYPALFVTLGVTETLWLDTVPFVAVGVPAVPDGIALTVISTSSMPSYPTDAVIVSVYCDVDGVYVFAMVCNVGALLGTATSPSE